MTRKPKKEVYKLSRILLWTVHWYKINSC